MEALGIDIGGTGIKGALVDTDGGQLLSERFRLLTPRPSTPKRVIATTAEIVAHFHWHGPVGCGFPAVIKKGVVHTAANVSDKWIGVDAEDRLGNLTGCPTTVINDADAAGMAEMRFGAGCGHDGVVLIITLGTGIGTAIFSSHHLLPNTELGHMEVDGKEGEAWAAEIVRKREGLSWEEWAGRLDKYLRAMENLFWPDLIIIGGGASKKQTKFMHHLTIRTQVVPAEMLNEAGIVGAALATESR